MQLVVWDLLRGLHIRGGPQAAALRPQVPPGVHRPLVPVLPGLLAPCGVPNLQRTAVPDSVMTCNRHDVSFTCDNARLAVSLPSQCVACSHLQSAARQSQCPENVRREQMIVMSVSEIEGDA